MIINLFITKKNIRLKHNHYGKQLIIIDKTCSKDIGFIMMIIKYIMRNTYVLDWFLKLNITLMKKLVMIM